MKIAVSKKQVVFYIWVGFAFSLFWLVHILTTAPGEALVRYINQVWAILYVVVVNFILFEYTLQQANRKRFLLFFLLLFVHLVLYSYGLYLWRSVGIALHIYTPLKNFASVTKTIEYHLPFSVASVFFFGIIRHIYNYQKLKQATQTLRIEKQEAELNYLKSQTNPHFLFNTLNNIYALAREKSDLAPESILRLSKILRFMLYEAGGDYISVEQELKMIDDYLALEGLRYDESLRVNFNHDVEDMRQSLPPLLLMPLVENAFKHGASETRGRPFVDIHLSVRQRQLSFLVKNSSEEYRGERTIKENIGLANLRRQLALLYTDYNLAVQQDVSVFTASLKINLASHV